VAISGRIHGTWSVLAYVKVYVMKRQPAVYLLTNKPDGTLYIGVTSDLPTCQNVGLIRISEVIRRDIKILTRCEVLGKTHP
jgi:hypothetical protein